MKIVRNESEKPLAIIDYNKHKSYIDLSDQMNAYSTSLRRGVKWYSKLAIELLLGTTIVKAFILHQEVANGKMSITQFKEKIAIKVLELEGSGAEVPKEGVNHKLIHLTRLDRRRCITCYEKIQREYGRIHAQWKAKQTQYKCVEYSKPYCLDFFFFEVHHCTN
ncbi:hypothetical protein NQ314_007741 [Rhamnusium bicolor]|uniref:Uncharacterized protein n=1 Tax=Rhamnusium bicolor TaxID=1586634 RepID=A0AAV8YJG3_9CUCU|nr:hypothetical protein NQ314_007741 [Rhamnusium bicolor]